MKASYLKPLLPLRDIVIFPSMVVPLFVGREKSIKALQEVMKTDKSVVLVTQKNSEIDDPSGTDLYQYGCLSKVLQLLKLPDGTVKVLVEGEKRVKIIKHNEPKNTYLTCEVEVAEDQNLSKDLEILALGLVKKFDRLQVLNKKDLNDDSANLKNLKDPSQIANNISSNLNIQIFEKQELLEILDLKKRLEKIHQLIEKETSVLSVEKKELADLVSFAKNFKSYFGNGNISPSREELKIQKLARKGIYFKRPLKKEHLLSSSDLAFLRPQNGLDINNYKFFLGKKLNRDVFKYQSLRKKYFE